MAWENCSATLSTTNPIWTALGSNLGMHSIHVLTNDLCYGTAFEQLQEWYSVFQKESPDFK